MNTSPQVARVGRPKREIPLGVPQLLLLRPVMVDICYGDLSAGLMLSQAHNWSDPRQEDTQRQAAPVPDATASPEFTATHQAWTAATGLSRHEQKRVRQVLSALGFWQVERRGMPARLYFRLNRRAIADAVGRFISDRSDRA